MIKKLVSVLLALCVLGGCLLLPAAAQTIDAQSGDAQSEFGVISVKLNSDVAGYTENDIDKFIEIRSANVVSSQRDGGPVSVADYAGTHEFGALVAGRTYFIDYAMVAAEGCTLPDNVEDLDVAIECGKGVSVYHTAIVSGPYRDEDGVMREYKGFRIQAKVVVDGNAFQRVFGWIHDLILKIEAWSLY